MESCVYDYLKSCTQIQKVHYVSEVFSVNGRSLDPRMLTDEEVRSSRVFSIERPTSGDIEIWNLALRDIADAHFGAPHFGPYLCVPSERLITPNLDVITPKQFTPNRKTPNFPIS